MSDFKSHPSYNARYKIGEGYIGFRSNNFKVNTISFQPRGVDKNEDRVVTKLWQFNDQRWMFLAVFDGHLGPTAADFTSQTLPDAIYGRLWEFVQSIGGRLDRSNIATHQAQMTKLLKDEIEAFDKAIGDAVREICPRPEDLTEEQARRLIDKHKDILERAFYGTTMAFALINPDERFMWAAGVGDSSVGLSYIGRDGRPKGQRLCRMHTFKDRQEYFHATMVHPGSEQPLFDWEDRILGWQTVARAIGNFSMKFPAPYLANLFRYLPSMENWYFDAIIARIKTPPYIVCSPSVRFTDLQPVWRRDSKIFLFTDGVDNLVDGWLVFKPRQHSGADPIDVVSALLADSIEPRIAEILGHQVIPRWSGPENNRATDVLGNLLGGTNIQRLEAVTDLERLNDEKADWPFHIDDTSIIVWRFTDH
ncbi:protein serine/threonine phosphatase 2C [Trametes versicolor FP-101664 SS1]|uniref:protein serine/threonine phosphatase 2C n=1 Tax=Trametes versicolor (strain FP-101664) TaxID=717944 RepID=UPI00046227BB|nr:protein serine/threonine phosphatase 2C [Trametes versicolor FP-101664 SS1]EIW57426.1 protein serine/threonine phosphatase 2C [Trametes versicolor FP-101664 SS1]